MLLSLLFWLDILWTNTTLGADPEMVHTDDPTQHERRDLSVIKQQV